MMPKVSIIIPTRNRGYLLKNAIKSALDQDYEDIEVIVSDNSSTDNTKTIFDSFINKKLRYVRSDEILSMPDSWEYALNQSNGEYITCLPDDDVYIFPDIIKRSLEALSVNELDVAVWNICSYFAPDWLNRKRQNLIVIKNSTFRNHIIPSSVGLKALFDMKQGFPVPKFLNSLCHRDIIENAKRNRGRLFLPTCPDFTAAVAILNQIDKYLFIDWPYYADGVNTASTGAIAAYNWGPALEIFFKEFKGTLYSHVSEIKLDIPIQAVHIAQSIEEAQFGFPQNKQYRINKKEFIRSSIDSLTNYEINRINVANKWKILNEYISTQSGEIKKWAKKYIFISKYILKYLKKYRNNIILEYFDKFRGIHVFRGKRWGFNNIEECKVVAPSLVHKLEKSNIWKYFKKIEYSSKDSNN